MLKLFYGTDQQALADRLLEECRSAPGSNPLSPEVLIVQNHGMGQWLTMHRARIEGVAANMIFEFPAERMWKLVRQLHPDLPEVLPSDRGPMAWSLLELLEEQGDVPVFAPLRFYMDDENPDRREIRKWKLSNKIADVFDQYLVYRPDLLLKWQEGKSHFPDNETERWQSELWRKLENHWRQNFPDLDGLHRARLQQELFTAIENDQLDEQKLPDRISVFGVSGMPPALVQTLTKLSDKVEVTFYQLAVDRTVTHPEDFGNPLIQSLGKVGADFSNLLQQSIKRRIGKDEKILIEEVAAPASEDTSDFSRVKIALKNDESPTEETPWSGDGTIRVHACHSPMREVEVLYDQLLSILDENPGLTPDELLIMTPDIETYAPVIRAVFDVREEGRPEIPYHIADRGVEGGQPATDAFLHLLNLLESRFKVTDLLDLLDTEAVRSAFDIPVQQIGRIEQWVADNRIRWGIDSSFKSKLGLPATDHFTWKSGLRRMLLGYMMEPHEEQLFEGQYPYEEIASSDDAVLAGKLAHFLESLFELYEKSQTAKNIDEWADLMAVVVRRFFPDTREIFSEVARIRQLIDTLKEQGDISGYDRNVPFHLIRSWFQNHLEEQHTGGGRIGQGVTFSSLMPMRSIPFRLIGMIGMNDDAFPRPQKPVAFDLMSEEQRPGDPVNAREDRYLFLENILSAGSHLYFSYVGQSNRDDTDFPPSVILTEFLDYLESNHGVSVRQLVQKHPLQAFSPRYFREESLFSYSQTQKKISERLMSTERAPAPFIRETLSPPEPEKRRLSLSGLVAFYQHPIKYVMQNRLGIYLREEEVIDEDREPFALGALDAYQINQQLLDRYIRDKPLDLYRALLSARDQLPEGWVGRQAYAHKMEEVRDFGEAIAESVDQEPMDDLPIDLSMGDFRLVGSLSGLYPSYRLDYHLGKMKGKYFVSFWVKHIALQMVREDIHPNYSLFYGRGDYGNIRKYELSPVENAPAIMEKLLQHFWRGQQQWSYLFTESAYAYSEQLLNRGKEEEEALQYALKKWNPSSNGYPGEREDAYIRLAVGSANPLESRAFREAAVDFWAPFFQHLKQERV